MSSSSYSTSSKSSRSEAEFQKLSQTIATSIQKILQNGKIFWNDKEIFEYHIEYLENAND